MSCAPLEFGACVTLAETIKELKKAAESDGYRWITLLMGSLFLALVQVVPDHGQAPGGGRQPEPTGHSNIGRQSCAQTSGTTTEVVYVPS